MYRMPRYNIDVKKVYDFPKALNVVYYKDKILVIAPEVANWLVLESAKQLRVLDLFRSGQSIENVIQSSAVDMVDVKDLVTQIEAKKFYKKEAASHSKKENLLHLYLTNKCNLSCPHCYMFSGIAEVNELYTTEVKKLISDFVHIDNGVVVTLSGGEPTLRPDFDEIVKYAYSAGLEVKLLTNATQISPERVALLSKYISSVQISIDGYSETSNAIIRGRGNFDKAIATVDSFISNGVYTSVAITPTLECLKSHVENYISFAQILSEKYYDKPFELRFSEELLNGRCISDAEKINDEYGRIMTNIQKSLYGSEFMVMEFVKKLRDNPIITNCSFGNLTVNASGDVFLCPRISDLMPIGNIRKNSFKDIISKAEVAEQATSINNLEPCKDCDLRYICGGGCRIKEFPGLTSRETFSGVNPCDFPRQTCNNMKKSIFYDLMIRSNEYFYSEIGQDK